MTACHLSKFGFIVHCRNATELRLALLRYRFSPWGLFSDQKLKEYCLKKGFIENIFTFKELTSERQAVCQGKAFCLLLTPEQMLENQSIATELVIKACKMAEDWGAQMIGLGAICAVIGARGVEAAQSCSAAVTTGNALTVYAAVVAFEKIMQRLEADQVEPKIAIVGFPGSIALALTKILYERGLHLIVVSRRQTAFLKKFTDNIGTAAGSLEITQDLHSALQASHIIFTATSTGQIIEQNTLLPGSVVLDIAQPKDVIYCENGRKDVLIIDAGTIALPRSTKQPYRYSGFGLNDIPSCLGETITLTFEKKWEQFSLGRNLPVDKIEEIGRLSEQHGFVFDEFRSFGKPVSPENFSETKKALLGPHN